MLLSSLRESFAPNQAGYAAWIVSIGGVMFLTGMMLKDGWDDGYGWFTMAFWTVMMVFWMVYDGSYPLGCPNIGFFGWLLG